MAKLIGNQPFNLGDPKPHENVLPGSMLRKINIASRQTYEDYLRDSGKLKVQEAEGTEGSASNESGSESKSDNSSSGDDRSTVVELNLTQMHTNGLLSQVVDRFDISHLTLRVNYTREDVESFPIVLDVCRQKLEYLALTRYTKVYIPEMELQVLSNPFEAPDELPMLFPNVFRLSIAHNIVDDINKINDSFPALQRLSINVILTEFQCKPRPYSSYVKTNLLLSMKFGKPMEKVKTLVWNIQEARHHTSQKRTIVYKSNAIRHLPQVFPNLSKLSVSITTAHDLHVIFRHCIQLHDLIVLKNSFYRIKDDDVIGEDESVEEASARLGGNLHPTRIKNGGIKQLKYLRRLSLENNNCCLTDRSIKHGLVHLRRLRSLHISRSHKITITALKLLQSCRFLVHVSVTKDNINPKKTKEEKVGNGVNTKVQQVQQTQPLDEQTAHCSKCRDRRITISQQLLMRAPGGFQQGTKWNKIGARHYNFVITTYEVNGRTYRLTRRHYDDEPADNQEHHGLDEFQEIPDMEEDSPEEYEPTGAEINPLKIILRAEKRIAKQTVEEESDYEKFINDFDDDYETEEEGYNDRDEELLLYGKRVLEEDEDSDDDGICPEDDSMYEGDKEFYLDTEGNSSDDDESYCDSETQYDYHADKETEAEETNKQDNRSAGDPKNSDIINAEGEETQKEDDRLEEAGKNKAEADPKNSDVINAEGEEAQKKQDDRIEEAGKNKAEGDNTPVEINPEDRTQQTEDDALLRCIDADAQLLSPVTNETIATPPFSANTSQLASSYAHSEMTGILRKLTKELSLSREKRKSKSERKKKPCKHEKNLMIKSKSEKEIPVPLKASVELPEETTIEEKILSWQATESKCVEYEESIRRMSTSSMESQQSTVEIRQDDSFDEFCESMISMPTHGVGFKNTRRHTGESLVSFDSEGLPDYSESHNVAKSRNFLLYKKTRKHKKHKSKSKSKREESNAYPTTSHKKSSKRHRFSSTGVKEGSSDLRKVLIERMVSEVKKELRK